MNFVIHYIGMNNEEEKMLSPREAGKYLEVTHTTIRRYIQKGILTGYKIGVNLRVKLSELQNYIETTKIK